MAGNRRNIHDVSAALFPHDGRHGLHALHGSKQIGVEELAALRHIECLHSIVEAKAGIIDQDVDPSKLAHSGLYHGLNLLVLAHVAGHADGVLACANSLTRCFLARPIAGAQDKSSAVLSEQFRDRLANAHRGPGNYSNFAL